MSRAELERNPLLERGADGETAAAAGTTDATPPMVRPAQPRTARRAPSSPTRAARRRASTRSRTASLDEARRRRPRLADMPAGYSEWAAAGSPP